MQLDDFSMRAEMDQIFIEQAWENHAMSITVSGFCYDVNFKQTRKMADEEGVQADY